MQYTYKYPHFALTADAVVFSGSGENLEVLLIRRANEPFKDHWGFPGGFVDIDERIDDAVYRELKEETGLTGVSLKRFDVFDAPDRDPRERTVTLVYYCFTHKEKHPLKAGDDAAEAAWFAVKDLPPLAFDHDEIIRRLIIRVGEVVRERA